MWVVMIRGCGRLKRVVWGCWRGKPVDGVSAKRGSADRAMGSAALHEVRCPRCGRYKVRGSFRILEMKCEKCKLRFEVKAEGDGMIFTAMES